MSYNLDKGTDFDPGSNRSDSTPELRWESFTGRIQNPQWSQVLGDELGVSKLIPWKKKPYWSFKNNDTPIYRLPGGQESTSHNFLFLSCLFYKFLKFFFPIFKGLKHFLYFESLEICVICTSFVVNPCSIISTIFGF